MGLLDRPDFCTLFVAVDDHYLDKLMFSYPTWVNCHPELLNMPHLFVFDAIQVNPSDERWDDLRQFRWDAANRRGLDADALAPIQLLPWVMPEADSQRERMLTALVRGVDHVKTPWYLKLDADTFATEPKGFYYDRWFSGNPAYIASPWGYTKPATALADLDRWAQGIPWFAGTEPLDPGAPKDLNGRTKVLHHRMASWVMFGNTAFTKEVSALCPTGKLPFPSQDTYLSYCCARKKAHWVPVKFRAYGWEHCKNVEGLRAACQKTLADLGIA